MISAVVRTVFGISMLTILLSSAASAAEVRIAVASNFKHTMTTLVDAYKMQSSDTIIVSYGSTGKHYAQIKNGAPFDLFYAADEARPMLLEQQAIAVENSRYTYAIGKLVLWGPAVNTAASIEAVLANTNYRHLALANPKLSPYGLAAQQFLTNLGSTKKMTAKLVQGENIAQAYQFVDSGNADLGLLAYSQIIQPEAQIVGSYWLVPTDLYQPIRQQAVLLKESTASRAFFRFVQSELARDIIREAGYATP